MRIQISHPHLADQLVQSLNETDCFAALTATDGVDVFVPWLEGARDAAQAQTELLFFVRAWGMKHPGFEVLLD